MEGWAKIPEASKYSGLKPRTFRILLKKGLRHARLPSGTILVKFSDIDEYLRSFEQKEDRVDAIVDSVLKEMAK